MDITTKQKTKLDSALEDIKDHYHKFGSGIAQRNAWFYFKPVGSIYVIVNSVDRNHLPNRDGYFSTIMHKSLVLSNISIEPKFVSRGVYTYMADYLEEWCDSKGVHLALENIMEHKFAMFNKRRGYKVYQGGLPDDESDYIVCSMYRPVMTSARKVA